MSKPNKKSILPIRLNVKDPNHDFYQSSPNRKADLNVVSLGVPEKISIHQNSINPKTHEKSSNFELLLNPMSSNNIANKNNQSKKNRFLSFTNHKKQKRNSNSPLIRKQNKLHTNKDNKKRSVKLPSPKNSPILSHLDLQKDLQIEKDEKKEDKIFSLELIDMKKDSLKNKTKKIYCCLIY